MTDYYLALTSKETGGYGVDPAIDIQEYRVRQAGIAYDPTRTPVRTVEAGLQVQRTELTEDKSVGPVVMNVHLDKKWGRWPAMVMGKESVSTVNVSVGRHVLTFKNKITDADAYPSFTAYKGIGIEERAYSGFGVSHMKFEQPVGNDSLLKMSADTFAKKFSATAALRTLSAFSNQRYLSNAHLVTQTIGGSAVKFEGFEIDIEGPAMPIMSGGSIDYSAVDLKPVSVKFKGNIRFLTNSHLEDFRNGTAKAIVIKYAHGDNIAGSNPALPYSLQFDLHQIKWNKGDVVVNEQQRLVQVLEAELEQDSSDNYFSITIDDETTTAYV